MTTIIEPRPKCALIWNDDEVSYADLLRRVAAFRRHVTGSGARVVIFAENRPEWVYAAYAVWMSDSVIVPVDYLASAEELAYVIDDCQPTQVFCSRKTQAVAERSAELATREPCLAVLDDLDSSATPGTPGTPTTPATTTSTPDSPFEGLDVDDAALAAIVYTSGTTGSPKGVMLSFGNLLANVRPVVNAGYFDAQARVLLLLPLHHVLPLAGSLLAPLFGGSTIVFATSMAGEELVGLLRRHRITVIVGVPRFYDLLHRALRGRIDENAIAKRLFALAKRVRSRRFSRLIFGSVHRKFGGALRYLVCGGAALNRATAETFDVLGFYMCEGYGMTECAPMISFPRPDRIRLGACGQVLDGCEMRIDESGEILARGPNVMLGYLGRPEETAAILRDGWLHTGDIGRIDEQGFLYVTGRLKDIVVFASGKKLDPGAVEGRFEGLPVLREVGVFLDGDTLHVLVVPNWDAIPVGGRDAAEDWLRREVIDPYNATVSPYRRITRVTLVETELPRTRLGKLRRHLLAGIAESAARTASDSKEIDGASDTIVTQLGDFLSRQSGKVVRGSTRLLADLGLDSLGRVELAVFLARAFGVTIGETQLTGFDTVTDLAEYVAKFRKADNAAATEVSWAELLFPKVAPPLPHSGWIHYLIVHVSRILVRLLFNTKARGREQIPKQPFILVPNHQSYLDGLFVAAYLSPRKAQRTMFYAKAQHVRKRIVRYLADRCNTVVMDPALGFLPSLQQLAAGVRRGNNLMIFPEGTRSANGELGEFKDSYAILARELDVPVVPVVIDGAYAVLPRGSRLPKLTSPITITYLEPLHSSHDEAPEAFNARVRNSIADELARGIRR